jgi:hypothetical protein
MNEQKKAKKSDQISQGGSKMLKSGKVMLLAAALCMVLTAGVFAQAPNTLMYHGKLTDETGPISDPVNVTFRIYDADTEGTLLWTEAHTGLTPNELGVFTVELGGTTPFAPGVFDGSVRYLGITVGADEEMVPRQPITSVPYALTSGVPGLAYDYQDDYAVTEGVTAPLEVTVRVSHPGYLILEASGWAMLAATTTTVAWIAITISNDATLLDPVSLQWLWETPNPNSYQGFESFSVRNIVPVDPGVHTYYVTVEKATTASCNIINTFLSATFMPAWIGTGPPPSLATSAKMNTDLLDKLKKSLTDSLNQEKQ